MRRLDTLLGQGVIPKADFIKVDVEGFEKDVFEGAAELLAAGFLGVESETNFSTSETYPNTHFGLIQDVMLQHGMFVFDINFNRVPRAACQEARSRQKSAAATSSDGTGKPATFNVLFCRDMTAERDGSLYYPKLPPKPSVDQILKTMSIYELHGLNDIAVEHGRQVLRRTSVSAWMSSVLSTCCADDPISCRGSRKRSPTCSASSPR